MVMNTLSELIKTHAAASMLIGMVFFLAIGFGGVVGYSTLMSSTADPAILVERDLIQNNPPVKDIPDFTTDVKSTGGIDAQSAPEPTILVESEPIPSDSAVTDIPEPAPDVQSVGGIGAQAIIVSAGLAFVSPDKSPVSGAGGVLMSLSESVSIYLLDPLAQDSSKLIIATSSDLLGADFSALVGGAIFEFSGPLSKNAVAVLRTTEKVKNVQECSFEKKTCSRIPSVVSLPGGEVMFPVSVSFFYAIEKMK